ncbi:HAD-IIIA family hydrolase [Dysgonomonas sp. 511]|uniref:D-glycero-alpha-D-manno-heptose-1,7-bisphosphate 7-phosphatase n=1 Tax=Dysgonomonas sp. 511 TaxID=2302930 RepID=UPI0013D24141|nr:HAD-IIIA family hydrolase [Dysgonomonas sp. 511]NDV79330.1 HAD-IIIA family hydrolase [Dysgonomonas sp. 511]
MKNKSPLAPSPLLGTGSFLFLDRDGVINQELPGDYVKTVGEFIFTPQATEAIAILTSLFDRIFVVTNQRGIGRGVMSQADVDNVHQYMLAEIEKAGGQIDRIYICPAISPTCVNRKPNTGMAFRAQADFPEIDFRRSVMVGNSLSDIQFGNKLGMYTVLVGDKYEKEHKIYEQIDAFCENLYKFADNLQHNVKPI